MRWILLAALLWPIQAGNQSRDSTAESCRVVGTISRLNGLTEASGVAYSRRSAGTLWAIVDSGPPVIYALDAARGTIVGRVQVAGADVDDWEDVSVGPCPQGSCVFIADIGDNDRRRRDVIVYRTAEPDPKASATQPVEVFHASYPDGPQDAEALIVSPQGQLFIITKATPRASLYRYPAAMRAGERMQLERVQTLPIARVTDAEASPDGQWVAVRTYQTVLFYGMADLLRGSAQERFQVSVSSLREPQGEGVAMSDSGDVYLVGESASVGTFARLACNLNHR